jgi:hypothetical protein
MASNNESNSGESAWAPLPIFTPYSYPYFGDSDFPYLYDEPQCSAGPHPWVAPVQYGVSASGLQPTVQPQSSAGPYSCVSLPGYTVQLVVLCHEVEGRSARFCRRLLCIYQGYTAGFKLLVCPQCLQVCCVKILCKEIRGDDSSMGGIAC